MLADEDIYVSERINALNIPLVSLDPSAGAVQDEEVEIDQFSNVSLIVISFLYV